MNRFLKICTTLLFLMSIEFVFAQSSIQLTDLYQVGLGNVSLTTQGSQKITNQYIYSPYGIKRNINSPTSIKADTRNYPDLFNQIRKPLDITKNQFSYTGQASDPSTGLMMLGGFRNYAPAIGRFIQPDTYNSFSKARILNPNAYVKGNPITLTDPSGHMSFGLDMFSNLSITAFGIGISGLMGGLSTLLPALGIGAITSTLNILGSSSAPDAMYGALGIGIALSTTGLAGDAYLASFAQYSKTELGLSAISNGLGLTSSIAGIVAQSQHEQSYASLSQSLGIAATLIGLSSMSSSVSDANVMLTNLRNHLEDRMDAMFGEQFYYSYTADMAVNQEVAYGDFKPLFSESRKDYLSPDPTRKSQLRELNELSPSEGFRQSSDYWSMHRVGNCHNMAFVLAKMLQEDDDFHFETMLISPRHLWHTFLTVGEKGQVYFYVDPWTGNIYAPHELPKAYYKGYLYTALKNRVSITKELLSHIDDPGAFEAHFNTL